MTFNNNSLGNLNPAKYPNLGPTVAVKVPAKMKKTVQTIMSEFERIYDEFGEDRAERIVSNLLESLEEKTLV